MAEIYTYVSSSSTASSTEYFNKILSEEAADLIPQQNSKQPYVADRPLAAALAGTNRKKGKQLLRDCEKK